MNTSTGAEWWRPDAVVDGGDRSGTVALARPGAPAGALPFWALIGFTFVLLIAPQSYFPALASARIALVTAAAAMAAHLFNRFVYRQPLTVLSRELWLVACLVGWAILTVPLSYWPGGSVSFLLNVYFKSLVIFLLLVNTVNSVKRIRQVFWTLSLLGVPLAVVGVKNFFSGAFLPEGAVKRIIGYDAPLTGNPNDLALMLNLIFPLSVALLLITRRPLVRAILVVIICVEAAAVIFTFSRGGFVMLATLFLLYLWKFRRRAEQRWVLAVLLPLLLCLPLLVPSYLDRLATIADIESDSTGSAQERWNDWGAAVRFVLRNPIVGAGVGQGILALNEERGTLWRAVHNVYLEHAVELGIPGMVLFFMLLAGCVKSATSVQRRADRTPVFRELFYLAEGIQISLLAFAVAALFYPVGYQFYFYYMAGLAIAAKCICESEQRKHIPSFHPARLH